jgi:holliday junction DNA helicase RuvA
MTVLARLRGTIEEKTDESIILFAGGIGFELQTPLSTLRLLPDIGSEVTLRTHLQVREGNIGLYGFATVEEQDVFELLLTVSGVGPRSSLNCLSLLGVDQLQSAIASGNVQALQRVPGIGRRTADRIVLELKERIGRLRPTGIPAPAAGDHQEVIEALMFYGYSAGEASAAVAALPKDDGLTIEEQTMMALRYFAPAAEPRSRRS